MSRYSWNDEFTCSSTVFRSIGMVTPTKKIIIDVVGNDENGNEMTQSFRLPTINDWRKNVISLNKKIIKKFNPQNGYALCVKENIIAYDDYKSLCEIIQDSDSNTRKIEIVSNKLLKPTINQQIRYKLAKQRRKIIIYSNTRQYTFTLPLDINESDFDIYNELITEIKLNFNKKSAGNTILKIYEKCDGKFIEISDWDDLYEALQDNKLEQTLHLYLKQVPSPNTYNLRNTEYAQIYQSQKYLMENAKSIIKKERIGKLVLVGDSGVGKSSIEQRFVSNKFNAWLEPTVGAMFSRKTLNYDNCKFTFEIWDTAGQDRYKSLTQLYYRNACAALICYDITNYKSYDVALKWIYEIRQSDNNIIIALCGNKIDLLKERNVSYDEVKQWSIMNNIAVFGETSAKTGVNIEQMFRKIGQIIVNTTQEKKIGFQLDEWINKGKVDDIKHASCYSYCQIV